MQKIALIPIGEAGQEISGLICRETGAEVITRAQVATCWQQYEGFVFVGALGICVRTIAPLVEDKHHDPAVVCIDSAGQHAIAVVSGHVGGANDLCRQVAAIVGAEAVVTTQSDQASLWGLDTLAQQFGWQLEADPSKCDALMNQAVFRFVRREPTALLLDIRDRGTDCLERSRPSHVTLVKDIQEIDNEKYRLALIVSHKRYNLPAGMPVLHFVPKVLAVGLGLAHQVQDTAYVLDETAALIRGAGYSPLAVACYASIDVKKDEPVMQALKRHGKDLHFYTADELARIEVPHPSATVEAHVGTPSVSEAAARLAANQGRLLMEKQKGSRKDFTLAVAIDKRFLREGHVEIVGAGPGDPDLVSVRGRRLLEEADLILYAGSLVPRELTRCAKKGAVVRSSASMDLEEQCRLMKEFYDRGALIVRLHTGDPCIFGAIQEQMAFFDKQQMSYHITPGISSFLAAAAELRSQFTIPERTQTIILTRGEGRTPMPEKEQLHLLARSQSTMCIFLSAAIIDEVQQELLMEYPPETPVAACYHLTWPDQKIYRGKLKDLSQIIHDNGLTLTTMIVVGEAIDNRSGLSELYDKHFTHLFRKARK